MIAQPNQHYDSERLKDLLEDRLSNDQAKRMELHLGQCSKCLAEMEAVAGQQQWWNETVDVLSDSTFGSSRKNPPSTSPAVSLDASVDWIRPLLETCPDNDSAIGRMDQYVVQSVIGQGGMGVVLKGIDPELNRPVAIKVLSPHLAGVGAARARFMREAQAAAAVVHPSIVPIYSVVTSSRLPYIVMPCITGGNLQQRIDREGPLDLTDVLRIGLQISEGLAAAHRHGVIHRDIKPANILVEEGNGRVLISDFGLARALDDATLTISGMIAGTPQYMSPEQARGDAVDARSDLYSLGSLLYALSTGRPPFRAESPLAVLRKITETTPRPIHQINERVPRWFDTLVSRLMQKQADHRVASAEVASQLLRDALAHTCNPSVHALPKGINRERRQIAIPITACLVVILWFAAAVLAWPWISVQQNDVVANSPNDTMTSPANPDVERSVEMANNSLVATDVDDEASTPLIDPLESAGVTWFDNESEIELASIRAVLDGLHAELATPSVPTRNDTSLVSPDSEQPTNFIPTPSVTGKQEN